MSKIYKMRIVFHWADQAEGRLDSAAALRSMLLSGTLPFARGKQNKNLPRLAYGPSVKQGQFAAREYADIYLLESVSTQTVRTQLEEHQPSGFTLLEVKRVPYALAGVQQLAQVAVYGIEGNFTQPAAAKTFENYVTAEKVSAVCWSETGVRLVRDVKPFLLGARMLGPQQAELSLCSVQGKWLNPLEVLQGWSGANTPLDAQRIEQTFKITRQGLYWQDSQQHLHLI